MRPIRTEPQASPVPKPVVGISSCLLGERVRYDGGHKWSALCAEHIAPFVCLQPICPESGIGLPSPRAPIDLIQTAEGMQAWSQQDPPRQVDDALRALAARVAHKYDLDGYILMQRSPSCALASAKVYSSNRLLHQQGSGIFAEALQHHCPELLLVEEQALHIEAVAFAFLCGIHIRQAWRHFTDGALASFHQAYGYLLQGLGSRVAQQTQHLERLATRADDSARAEYHQRLHTLLQGWLESPPDIAQWLHELTPWLQQALHCQERPMSLTDLATLLERSRSRSTSGIQPRALPFFRF